MEISRHLSLLTTSIGKPTTNREPSISTAIPQKKQLSYVSEVDLDNPHYAKCIFNKEDYVPANIWRLVCLVLMV